MAARGRAESSAVDDEFLHNLYKGGELLAAGKVIEAKDYLERAFKLQPKNEKGQNLLGLTYFKLGLFDRAAEIYETLVRDNPVDATLRVNLGLVYLKTNQLNRAIREFETACDLAPEHKKAHNYLGLALAQLGNYAEARDHFIEAGSDAMVQKMERAMAGEATGLHRMPAPLEQQKQQKFAEIEGSEIVAERGGQQVAPVTAVSSASSSTARSREAPLLETPPPPPPAEAAVPPEAEEIEVHEEAAAPAEATVTEEAASTEAVAPSQAASASGESWGAHFGGEDEMRLAADEGPSAIPASAANDVPESVEVDVEVSSPTLEPHPDEVVIEVPPESPSSAVAAQAVSGDGLEFGQDASASEPASDSAGAEAEASDAGDMATAAMAAAERASEPAVEAAAQPAAEPEQWEARPLTELKSEAHFGVPLLDLAPALEVLKGAVGAPFEVRPEGVAITVNGELLTRVEGLLMVTGAVKYEPELKRFRGRTTDQTFGDGAGRIMRASGRGVMVVAAPEKHRFVSIDLADESAYFREDVVYAFEEAVMFENGRVPSETTGDLDLVHLRGKGKVLLRLDGALRAHQVRMDEPATVPLERLVGWFGNVSPKLVALAVEETGKLVKGGAELSGEGFVLFAA